MEKIIKCLSEYLGIENEEINENSKLVEELGLSSFDLIDLSCVMEDEFQINISPKELTSIRLVKDLEDLICRKQEK